MSGMKFDDEKDRWELLPLDGVRQIVQVLGHGAKKYGDHNWREVPNGEDRYFAAAMRHMAAHRSGEYFDQESGLPHVAHALTSMLFMTVLALRTLEVKKKSSIYKKIPAPDFSNPPMAPSIPRAVPPPPYDPARNVFGAGTVRVGSYPAPPDAGLD